MSNLPHFPEYLLTDEQKSYFLDFNKATKMMVDEKTVLYRFIQNANGRKFSGCWIDGDTVRGILRIIRTWEQPSKQDMLEVVRKNLAILTKWNELNYLIRVRFKTELSCYKGIVGPQKLQMTINSMEDVFQNNNFLKKYSLEARIGGFDQYFIPCLDGMPRDEDGDKYAEVEAIRPVETIYQRLVVRNRW